MAAPIFLNEDVLRSMIDEVVSKKIADVRQQRLQLKTGGCAEGMTVLIQ